MSIETQSVNLAGYQFNGPYGYTASLLNRSGVYTILTITAANVYEVLDVGESAKMRTRVENHDRKHCWSQHAYSRPILVAAYYTSSVTTRKAVEQIVRQTYTPPCGKR